MIQQVQTQWKAEEVMLSVEQVAVEGDAGG